MGEYIELTGNKNYVSYKDCKEGQVLVDGGVFSATSQNKFGKINFEFMSPKGETVILNECGSLAYNFKEQKLKIGLVYKIVYDGMPVMKKGIYAGKPFHQLKIYQKQEGGAVETLSEDQVPF